MAYLIRKREVKAFLADAKETFDYLQSQYATMPEDALMCPACHMVYTHGERGGNVCWCDYNSPAISYGGDA